MRKVHTIFNHFHLKKLGDIDGDSGYKCEEDVHESSTSSPLNLTEVMRPTYSQVPLHTHSYDQVDTKAEADPESFYMVSQQLHENIFDSMSSSRDFCQKR